MRTRPTLALVALVFALFLAEILTRLLCPESFSNKDIWPGFDGQLRDGLFVPDPVAGYRPGPAWAPEGRYGFRNGAEYGDTSSPAKDIVLLGDSLIQDGQLGQAMKEELAGKDCRVWVAGIGGYNTLQEAHYLEHWIKLSPDVLVLAFCLNDFATSMVVVPGARADDRKMAAPDFEPLAAVHPRLFQASALYRLFVTAGLSRGVRERFSPEVVRQNRGHVRRGLEQMKQYAAQRGIPFVVILYPHLEEKASPWLAEAHMQARAIFDELGLRWIDLTDDYAARGPLSLRTQADDPVHPNRQGHAIAAQKLIAAHPEIFDGGP